MFLTMFLNLSFKVNHTKHRLGLVVHNQFDSFVKVSTTCSFDLKNLSSILLFFLACLILWILMLISLLLP